MAAATQTPTERDPRAPMRARARARERVASRDSRPDAPAPARTPPPARERQAPPARVVTQADIDRWRQDPWSIDFPLADDGTPPGFRYAGDGWVDMGGWRPEVAARPSACAPHVTAFVETLVAGRLYETVTDERPMFVIWQAWEPLPR